MNQLCIEVSFQHKKEHRAVVNSFEENFHTIKLVSNKSSWICTIDVNCHSRTLAAGV